MKETLEAAQKKKGGGGFIYLFILIGNIKCQQYPAYTILIQFMAQYCYPYHQLPWELPEQWVFIMCGAFHTICVPEHFTETDKTVSVNNSRE